MAAQRPDEVFRQTHHISLRASFITKCADTQPICSPRGKDHRMKEKEKPHKLELGKLYGNPLFICYLIYTALQYIPQTAMQYYQPYLIREVGANMAFIGYLQAYRASFEIPTLMFSYKLTKKISLKGMVIIS